MLFKDNFSNAKLQFENGDIVIQFGNSKKILSDLTLEEIEILQEREDYFYCPCSNCSNVKMLICKNPNNNGAYLRTCKEQKNKHDKNCKYSYCNKSTILNESNKRINSETYRTIRNAINSNTVTSKDSQFTNIGALNKIAELRRGYFYGNISDIKIINNTVYINIINNKKIYVDLMFGKSFFENTQINIKEFKNVFDNLKFRDIRECVCYGVLNPKNNQLGFNIKIFNILDFLIDGNEIYKYI